MPSALIVDDSNFVRLRLKALLTKMGIDILAEASDGKEALLKYNKYNPDIVTMDINMPEMNGIEAMKKIKAIDSKANIVIVSTEGQETVIHDAIISGARYFIIKPFQTNQFANIIRAVLDNSNKIIDKSIENLEIDENVSGVILTIDDSKTVLYKLRELLKKDDHIVIQSNAGKRGLEFAISGSPDLILLDLSMPEMDGFEVLKELQKNEITRKIPVIVLSDRAQKEDVLTSMKFGVVDYISKNLNEDVFRHKVKVALHNFKVSRNNSLENEEFQIFMTRKDNQTILSYREKLSNKETKKMFKKIFTATFLDVIKKDLIVLDFRMIPEIDKDDLDDLVDMIFKLQENRIVIITGKHYGFMVSEANLEESVELFISYGDFELFLKNENENKKN